MLFRSALGAAMMSRSSQTGPQTDPVEKTGVTPETPVPLEKKPQKTAPFTPGLPLSPEEEIAATMGTD